MKKNSQLVLVLSVCIGVLLTCSAAIAAGTFSVNCTYSHTLADDSIVHYGQPGQAMVHDFFGNTKTDAFSEYTTLNSNKLTTCDVPGDVSAYWVPQLKRGSGIVAPDFAKTYYRNDQPVMPVSPIPPGLQMLAGDHRSTGPKPQINYLCRGSGYTTIAPTYCPVVTDANGTYAQLDISIHFPDCWDGKTLKPGAMRAGDRAAMGNMAMSSYTAYRNADGTCPPDFPVKIPELQVNVQYSLGQDPDLADAQLSMDPILSNGVWVPQWGSLYTAHADFISAWKTDSMQYAVTNCSNANVACGNKIPLYYSVATENAWADANGIVNSIGPTLQLAPGGTIFIKVPTPQNTDQFKWEHAYLQNQGHNATDTSAVMLQLYQASTQWNEDTQPPAPADCMNTGKTVGGIYLDNIDQRRLNDITSYVKSSIQSGAPVVGICIRNPTDKTITFSSIQTQNGPALFLK